MSIIRELLHLLAEFEPVDDGEIEAAHDDHSSHYNDTLDRGIGLGERLLADRIREVFDNNT
jgi:hypothetical protein